MGAKSKTNKAAAASTEDQFGPPGSLCAKYLSANLMREVLMDEEGRKV